MAGIAYVGPDAATGDDVESRLAAEDVLNLGVSRAYVIDRVTALKAARATQEYVDNQDATKAPASYYGTQDALLVPLTAKGAASGVATLDGTGKMPTSQVPVLGAGFIRGPYGANQAFGGTTTGATPLKIAQWNLGITGVTGQVYAWMNTSVQTNGTRPVIEIRMGTTAQTAYADQTLIARGVGRDQYSDYQLVTAWPAAVAGEGQDGVQDTWPANTALLANAWAFTEDVGTLTTSNTSIASAVLFLTRTTL